MTKNMAGALLLLLSVSFSGFSAEQTKLQDIKNYTELSSYLSSSGLPDTGGLKAAKDKGFKHIINLIPGDYKGEKITAESLGMSFEQIEVDWHHPKLNDFETFVGLMKSYGDDKVLVHCYINYRASAFSYLYQVTQLGVGNQLAKEKMLEVWEPEGNWLEFINMIKSHYDQ